MSQFAVQALCGTPLVCLLVDFIISHLTVVGIMIKSSSEVCVHVMGWSDKVAFSYTALPSDTLSTLYYTIGYSPSLNSAWLTTTTTTTTTTTATTTTTSVTQSVNQGDQTQATASKEGTTEAKDGTTAAKEVTTAAKEVTTAAKEIPTTVGQKAQEVTSTAAPQVAASESNAAHFVLVVSPADGTTILIKVLDDMQCFLTGSLITVGISKVVLLTSPRYLHVA